MIVYLAGPIDYANKAVQDTRAQLQDLLEETGYTYYNPASAWTVHPDTKPTPALQQINEYALAQTDILVAFLVKGVPTIGTVLELKLANKLGMFIYLYAPDYKNSWALARLRNVIIFDDLEVLRNELTVKATTE